MKTHIPIVSTNPITRLVIAVLVVSLAFACRFLSSGTPDPVLSFEPHDEPLVFNPATLPEARVGEPYEVEIQITQNVTPVGDFSVDPDQLPPGLELLFTEEMSDSTLITGTPEQAGNYQFTLSAWCYGTMVSGQTGEKEYTIVVE